jgi:CO dehydrogenase nickel-insertion accessory protein CooC1
MMRLTGNRMMAKEIVSTGRVWVGKASFAALVSRYLKSPTLLVDLDPDLSLADMFGFDFCKEGYKL